MMRLQILLLMSSAAVFCHAGYAVNVYQCEDERGNISFQDRCPPGTKQVNQKEYKSGPVSAEAGTAAAGPVTLYTIPDCDTCDQLKEFLSVRGITVTEINVAEDIALQNEVKEKAGELQVPVLIIGDKVLTGYNRATLIQVFTESGLITEENP